MSDWTMRSRASTAASSVSSTITAGTLKLAAVNALPGTGDVTIVPSTVINGLTDLTHPCQAMADVMTLEEHFGVGNLTRKTIAFIGDGNNVARSLAVACGKFGIRFVIATPPGYELADPQADRIMSKVPISSGDSA